MFLDPVSEIGAVGFNMWVFICTEVYVVRYGIVAIPQTNLGMIGDFVD